MIHLYLKAQTIPIVTVVALFTLCEVLQFHRAFCIVVAWRMGHWVESYCEKRWRVDEMLNRWLKERAQRKKYFHRSWKKTAEVSK